MKTRAALCAREIKQKLKEIYPGVAFRVKSDNFSMGDSVDIYWNFGPTQKEIESIINDYSAGDFDGKQEDNKPRAKYVHATREYKTTEEQENYKLKYTDPNRRNLWKEEKSFYHIVTRDLCALFNLPPMRPDQEVPEDYKHMVSGYGYITWYDVIHKLLYNTSLPNGYNGVRLEKTEDGKDIIKSAQVY